MAEMTTEQIQDELRRGIEFYKELDGQVLAFLNRLAEVLEDKYELGRLKKPFAKSLRQSSVVQSYLLLMKPTGAEIESEDADDDSESEEEDEVDTRNLEFAPDAKLPYVAVQMIGKVPAGANGSATTPFIQYGTLVVTGRKMKKNSRIQWSCGLDTTPAYFATGWPIREASRLTPTRPTRAARLLSLRKTARMYNRSARSKPKRT